MYCISKYCMSLSQKFWTHLLLLSFFSSLAPDLSLSLFCWWLSLACCLFSGPCWWLHGDSRPSMLEPPSRAWCPHPGATTRHFSQNWKFDSSSRFSVEQREEGGVNWESSPLPWGSWPRGGCQQADDWMTLLGTAVLHGRSNPRAMPEPGPLVSVLTTSSWPSSQLPQQTQELSRHCVATRGPQGSTSECDLSLSTVRSVKLGEWGLKITVADSFIPPIRWATTSAVSDTGPPSKPVSHPLVWGRGSVPGAEGLGWYFALEMCVFCGQGCSEWGSGYHPFLAESGHGPGFACVGWAGFNALDGEVTKLQASLEVLVTVSPATSTSSIRKTLSSSST